MDACASAFGFFLIGFEYIARYRTSHCIQDKLFGIYDPVLWFFKVFTSLIILRYALFL